MLSLILSLVSMAQADQCQALTFDQARAARSRLSEAGTFASYCAPCGDASPAVQSAAGVTVLGGGVDPSWYVIGPDGAIDAAYTYVPMGNGPWRQLSSLIACESSGPVTIAAPMMGHSPSAVAPHACSGSLLIVLADPAAYYTSYHAPMQALRDAGPVLGAVGTVASGTLAITGSASADGWELARSQVQDWLKNLALPGWRVSSEPAAARSAGWMRFDATSDAVYPSPLKLPGLGGMSGAMEQLAGRDGRWSGAIAVDFSNPDAAYAQLVRGSSGRVQEGASVSALLFDAIRGSMRDDRMDAYVHFGEYECP